MKLRESEREETSDEEDEGDAHQTREKQASLKETVEKVTSGAALALEVAGIKTPTRALGRKSMLASGVLSFLFGPFGFLYAAPLTEAIGAIVIYSAVGWLLKVILPGFLLMYLVGIVNIVLAIAGVLYAWGFNSAGKRVPLLLKEKGTNETPPLRKLLNRKK